MDAPTPAGGPPLRPIADADLRSIAAARATLERSARLAHVSPSLLAARAFEHQRLDAPALVDAAAALRMAMERDVPGARVDQRTKALLALAVMRTDAARVAQARADTARMGLDPDRWFGHVELGAARVLGRDVVDYVRRVAQYEAAFAWRFAPPRRPATSAARDQ